jgi:hypothetical protein
MESVGIFRLISEHGRVAYPRLQRTWMRAPLPRMNHEISERPNPRLGRRLEALLALALSISGCSERLTPSRAATIIRHSKAFLSGAPESMPVFDGISGLFPSSERGTSGTQEADTCIAEFSYHWPIDPRARSSARTEARLTARVVLRRLGNGWAVDDRQSRTLVPSWPQLPRTPSPLGR